MSELYLVAEFGIIALFLACAYNAWQARRADGGQNLTKLFSAALFATLFEDLNVRQLSGRGSYYYSDRFLLDVDQVPLFIILAWAVILWGAMRLSDALPLRETARVGADGSLAVLLDLGFDVTAIRYEFWTWRGFAFDQAWFGVPAGNFFGWLWVSLAFSALTRALWRWKPRGALWMQLFIVPLLGFVLYRAVETATNTLLQTVHATDDRSSLIAFFAVFALIVLLTTVTPKSADRSQTDLERAPQPFVHGSRAAFHLFAVGGLLVLPAGVPGTAQRPLLLLLAAIVWGADALWQRTLRQERLLAPRTKSIETSTKGRA